MVVRVVAVRAVRVVRVVAVTVKAQQARESPAQIYGLALHQLQELFLFSSLQIGRGAIAYRLVDHSHAPPLAAAAAAAAAPAAQPPSVSLSPRAHFLFKVVRKTPKLDFDVVPLSFRHFVGAASSKKSSLVCVCFCKVTKCFLVVDDAAVEAVFVFAFIE